jgi:outer membrane protein assembly factor BamB
MLNRVVLTTLLTLFVFSSAPTATTPTTNATWSLYRGNARQLGVASGRLPDKLKPKWKFKTGQPVISSPVVAHGRVYVGSTDGQIYALALSNGNKVWSFKTSDAIEAPPSVVGDRVVVGSSDGSLYALDAATGKLRWKYQTEDKILGAANWTTSPDGKATWIVVGSYDNRVHCVNADTGKAVWTYETGNYVNGTPAISDGKVIFGGCDGVLYVLNLADGKQIRSVEVKDFIAASAAVDGKFAYLGHYGNEFLCADVSAGKIVWTYQDRKFPFFSSPAVTPDRIVVGARDKRVHCLRRTDGKPLWTFRTRGKVDSSPVVCDNKVVVGSEDGRLYLLRLSDGKQLWSYQIGQPVMSSPAVVNGMVIIGADDGCVYAFGAAK